MGILVGFEWGVIATAKNRIATAILNRGVKVWCAQSWELARWAANALLDSLKCFCSELSLKPRIPLFLSKIDEISEACVCFAGLLVAASSSAATVILNDGGVLSGMIVGAV